MLSIEAVLFTGKEIRGNCRKENLLKLQKDQFLKLLSSPQGEGISFSSSLCVMFRICKKKTNK